MAEKTVRRRFIPCLFLFACMLILFFAFILPKKDPGEITFMLILTVLIALLEIHMIKGYCTLRKKYRS
ncbi:MAG: hypothetical protein LKE64_11445 [Solobacterium sp.]|nr:hypothetical protein [Solobacterium sp.]MCH4047871.1 hypothetical protein [Solobacterium sp.]MCH4075543.1 hypothetical protein [Solobacterium sp.]MCI1313261.1 hypothetical protein [Solobacterium sp.]MCI1346031.1 hypothetical protein [Solobacterium sp.]